MLHSRLETPNTNPSAETRLFRRAAPSLLSWLLEARQACFVSEYARGCLTPRIPDICRMCRAERLAFCPESHPTFLTAQWTVLARRFVRRCSWTPVLGLWRKAAHCPARASVVTEADEMGLCPPCPGSNPLPPVCLSVPHQGPPNEGGALPHMSKWGYRTPAEVTRFTF